MVRKRLLSIVILISMYFWTWDIRIQYATGASLFVVNDRSDLPDIKPGDGICATQNSTCTLRAAVMEANNTSGGGATVQIPIGTYNLTIPPIITPSEIPGIWIVNDAEDVGDLNITNSMIISGSGNGSTFINSMNLDRVLNIGSPSSIKVQISDITIENGISLCIPPGGGCDSRSPGGGVYINNPLSDVALIRTNIIGNKGGSGGGISNFGNLLITDALISNNTADLGGAGGGLYSGGNLELSKSIIQNNHASSGGGIYSQSANTINQGSLIIRESTIAMNTGGIVISTSGLIDQTTIDSNTINGGIINFGESPGTILNITKSTISNNKANASIYIPQRGGGITQRGGIVNIVNSTISGNTTNKSGGGIVVEAGTVNLYNTTISNNKSMLNPPNNGNGGGIFVLDGVLSSQNSILAGNFSDNPVSPSADCLGNINSLGYNLIGSANGCNYLDATTRTGLDILLGPLQSNGGSTFTQALLPHSPAIRSGNPNGCYDQNFKIITTDQRGYSRQNYVACDVGSFEVTQMFFPFVSEFR